MSSILNEAEKVFKSLDRKPFQDRLNALVSERQSWESAWKDIKTYIVPKLGFFDEQPNQGKMIDHKTILDSEASIAVRTLAAGMTSGLTSPSRPWFRLGLNDMGLSEFGPIKDWLDLVRERMMAVFSRSNIYEVFNSLYEETGAFGTGAGAVLEDYNTVIRLSKMTCGEYYLGVGPDNRVNTFGRIYNFTVGQMAKEFGIQNLSPDAKQLYDEGKIDQWRQICHLIEPNDDRIPDKSDFKNMPFRSVYWEKSATEGLVLRIGGFQEFPIVAPRWETARTADVYGKGPGWDCLGDAKMLQKMIKNNLIAIDKAIDPPMAVDDNTTSEVNTLPGGITRTSTLNPNGGVRPAYQIQPDLRTMRISIFDVKNDINRIFYNDLFKMLQQLDMQGTGGKMTAREVVERHEEKLLLLGPVLEKLKSELLDPLIDRTFAIMLRAGIIPPPPRELQGMTLKVEYISMLAQAQRMVGINAIKEAMSFAGYLAPVVPNIMDNIDADEAVSQVDDMLGVPSKITRGKDQVQAMRDKRESVQKAAAIAANAQTMVANAKTLSDTKMNQDSALDGIMSAVKGGAGVPGGANALALAGTPA